MDTLKDLREIYKSAQWNGTETKDHLEGLLNNIRDAAKFAMQDLGVVFDEYGKELPPAEKKQ